MPSASGSNFGPNAMMSTSIRGNLSKSPNRASNIGSMGGVRAAGIAAAAAADNRKRDFMMIVEWGSMRGGSGGGGSRRRTSVTVRRSSELHSVMIATCITSHLLHCLQSPCSTDGLSQGVKDVSARGYDGSYSLLL